MAVGGWALGPRRAWSRITLVADRSSAASWTAVPGEKNGTIRRAPSWHHQRCSPSPSIACRGGPLTEDRNARHRVENGITGPSGVFTSSA